MRPADRRLTDANTSVSLSQGPGVRLRSSYLKDTAEIGRERLHEIVFPPVYIFSDTATDSGENRAGVNLDSLRNEAVLTQCCGAAQKRLIRFLFCFRITLFEVCRCICLRSAFVRV